MPSFVAPFTKDRIPALRANRRSVSQSLSWFFHSVHPDNRAVEIFDFFGQPAFRIKNSFQSMDGFYQGVVMMNKNAIPVLAIDGGGTRCRLAVSAAGQLTMVESGSANVSTDFEAALGAVRQGLRQLSARSGVGFEALTEMPAFVGLAGVTGPEIAACLKERLGLTRACIMDDRPAALRGALGAGEGVVAHCGTGSFLAARIDQRMAFSGGWGAVLGDEASAQWVGRRALSVTLRCVDGRARATPLAERLLAELGGASGIVHFAGSASPADLGRLAPLVTAHAGGGDPLAVAIMQAGAQDIAASSRSLGWRPDMALCLTGGIGPQYAAYLPADMQAALLPPAGDPMSGAIALARDLACSAKGEADLCAWPVS